MTISFKQFSTFLTQARGEDAPEKLDEIFGKIFGKEEDKEGKKNQVLTAKELLAKKKEKEEERKKELQKKRDEDWIRAKERAEGGRSKGYPTVSRSDRDDYALHRQMKENLLLIITENKITYSPDDHGSWTDDAKAAGYKVKKVSGNLKDGDQSWCAYDEDDNKVGEFTESGKGGWLSETA
jgi:uncharacterized protein with von Willebrand factor type A (vWA) domain